MDNANRSPLDLASRPIYISWAREGTWSKGAIRSVDRSKLSGCKQLSIWVRCSLRGLSEARPCANPPHGMACINDVSGQGARGAQERGSCGENGRCGEGGRSNEAAITHCRFNPYSFSVSFSILRIRSRRCSRISWLVVLLFLLLRGLIFVT